MLDSRHTVHDVVGYALPSGDYTRALAGRYDADKSVIAGVVLCSSTACIRIGFAAADAIVVLGVVDLKGAPVALPEGQMSRYLTDHQPMGIPALVVKTTVAKAGERHATVLALHGGARMFPGSFEDGHAEGGGSSTTYRLERGKSKATLARVAAEQRRLSKRHSHGLQPKPTEARYELVDGHFQRSGEPPVSPGGCG